MAAPVQLDPLRKIVEERCTERGTRYGGQGANVTRSSMARTSIQVQYIYYPAQISGDALTRGQRAGTPRAACLNYFNLSASHAKASQIGGM